MMTGRERVIAALEFDNPDRVPRDLWPLPAITLFERDKYEQVIQKFPMDISRPESSPSTGDDEQNLMARVGTYRDDWGSIWRVGEPGLIGEVEEPALKDLSKLDQFSPPWHLIENKDHSLINRNCELSDKFMLSEACARPFERLQFLRGTEALFVDLAYRREEIFRLLDLLHEFYLENVRFWCETNVDGILFMDDWGMNDSLLISPQLFRKHFKPLYRDYCDLIHDAGKYAFFHSDGNIEEIYGDLIDVGIDAINSQLFCMNIESLAQKYWGQVTFWGEIDRQHILPFGTKEEVHEAVMRIRRALDSGSGGVIAQCEWGKNNPVANIKAVYEAWLASRPR